jgi:CheY-like chemotaxis protein
VFRRTAFVQSFCVWQDLLLSDDKEPRFWYAVGEMNETVLGTEQEDGGATEQRIQVLIADDRPRSRDGLKALLATWPELEVVGEAPDGGEAVQLVEKLRPDVVLMDARMPVMDGLEATRLIKERWPQVKVIVLTMYPSFQAVALAAGADAFLVKGCAAQELLEAILDH